MSKTKTMLATLALGATVAFAGPAFAEKMKATLDGKSEVPAEHQRRQGHRRYRLRCRHQEAELEADLFGPLRPGHRRPFPRARRSRQERRRRGRDPECDHEPGRGQRHADGRPGRRPDGRQVLCQRPHRGQSGRRNPRPGDEVSIFRKSARAICRGGASNAQDYTMLQDARVDRLAASTLLLVWAAFRPGDESTSASPGRSRDNRCTWPGSRRRRPSGWRHP